MKIEREAWTLRLEARNDGKYLSCVRAQNPVRRWFDWVFWFIYAESLNILS
jgi:hypothetical protein